MKSNSSRNKFDSVKSLNTCAKTDILTLPCDRSLHDIKKFRYKEGRD
jgi:hypothetical protein